MPTPAEIQLVPDKESNYAPLADFFNTCVANCDAAYDQLRDKLSSTIDSDGKLAERTDRWWPTLKFSPFGRKTKDGFVDAAPLKPNLVAGLGVLDGMGATRTACYWSLPPNAAPGAMEIRVPVEVKNNWYAIVKKAATYARALVSVNPLRLFSLVIGVNHKTHKLRFLIYHRDGLTASHDIDLEKDEGRRDVQRVLFSTLLWQTADDAGPPAFTNGLVTEIPSGDVAPSVRVVTDKVLYHSPSVRGRSTLVLRGIPPQASPSSPFLDPSESSCRCFRCIRRMSRDHARADARTRQVSRCVSRAIQNVNDIHETSPATIHAKQFYDRPPQSVHPPNMIGPPGPIVPSDDCCGVVLKFSWPGSVRSRLKCTMGAMASSEFRSI